MATQLQDSITDTDLNAADSCPNCEGSLAGDYCHQCGQKKIDPNEFSVRRFLGRLLTEVIDFESNKFLKTLRVMLLKPGLLTREYVAGRRSIFIGPVKLYLTFSAIYFLFAWSALVDIRGGGAALAASYPATIRMAQQRGVTPMALAEKVYEKAEKYASALRFMSVLVSGLFLSLLYVGLRKYYVEHLIFSLYYYSFDFFTKILFALLYLAVAAVGWKLPWQFLSLFYPISFIYILLALQRAYQQSWKVTTLKAIVLYLCETLLFIFANMTGFIIAFMLA